MFFFNKVIYILNEYKNLNMAYKLVLLLYSLINCFTLSAQTTDSVIMSIVYTSEYNYSKYKKPGRCDMMRLDIGKHASHFFSDYFEQKLAKMDSMNMSGSISVNTISTKFLSDPLTYMPDTYGQTILQEVINRFVPKANAKAKLHFLEYYDINKQYICS